MPFVLIVQLILSGVLFSLSGVSEFFSNFTLSKWGMSAFGSESDLNGLNLAINGRLIKDGLLAPPEYGGVMLKMDPINKFYEHNVGRLLLAWFVCIAITAFNAAVSGLALKLKNRDS